MHHMSLLVVSLVMSFSGNDMSAYVVVARTCTYITAHIWGLGSFEEGCCRVLP